MSVQYTRRYVWDLSVSVDLPLMDVLCKSKIIDLYNDSLLPSEELEQFITNTFLFADETSYGLNTT